MMSIHIWGRLIIEVIVDQTGQAYSPRTGNWVKESEIVNT